MILINKKIHPFKKQYMCKFCKNFQCKFILMYDEKLKKLHLNKNEFHLYGYIYKLLSNSQILIDMKSKISLNNVNFE